MSRDNTPPKQKFGKPFTVTPEMVSVGVAALFPAAELHPAAEEAEVLARVFRAMARLSPDFR